MRRRDFLRLCAAGLTVAGAAACGGATGSTGSRQASDVPLPSRFTTPLPIPPAARRSAADRVELALRTGSLEVFPGHSTTVHGYDGIFPGPTIDATVGQQLTVALTNELTDPAVLHLHGGRTPAEHDGYPTDVVLPGTVREYVYPLQQRAASLWYHDHTMDLTGPNVYQGQAGMFLLRDPAEDSLGLPSGARDIPLMICDRAFDGDYQLKYPMAKPSPAAPSGPAGHSGHGGHGEHSGHTGHGNHVYGTDPAYLGGVLADVMLVNGAPWPVLEVDAARYRLRLLNASNARRLELSLDRGGFTQIASDQGLLHGPIERATITLAQAERVDVVIDFAAYAVGDRIQLRNLLGSGPIGEVMEFVVARKAADDSHVPEVLSEYTVPSAHDAIITRDFHFALGPATAQRPNGVWTINGISFDDPNPIAVVQRGTVERWRLSTDVHHPVHVHLFQMFVTSHRSGPPGPSHAGIKDTIDLVPGDACEVLIPIDGYPGRYVIHCHNLEHEDMMMMANIDVR